MTTYVFTNAVGATEGNGRTALTCKVGMGGVVGVNARIARTLSTMINPIVINTMPSGIIFSAFLTFGPTGRLPSHSGFVITSS